MREENGWLVSDQQEHWFYYLGRIQREATAQFDSVLSQCAEAAFHRLAFRQRLPATVSHVLL